METYKDKTFCPFYLLCTKGYSCERALSEKVRDEAHKCGLPVCQYSIKPCCFQAVWEPMPLPVNEVGDAE